MVAHPFVYEINTWVWLDELSRRVGTIVDLGSVPDAEWEAIASLGFDAVWLMGVWERSPAGIAIALENPSLVESFRRALPDFTSADVVGSPYCVRDYVVDARLGGSEGLAVARQSLARHGLGLILDFVPNHVAPDHPWLRDHPEYFVRGDEADLEREPASFVRVGDVVVANGRDPYFPAWPDVVQLDAFSPGLRHAVTTTLRALAAQCDGVRCDMAMLVTNDVFERTWGQRAGPRPDHDYWPTVIPAVKADRPDFLFIAEAYWDMEWTLQQQGFDYCYDKRLYDRLVHEGAEEVHGHLGADLEYQRRLVRFVDARPGACSPPRSTSFSQTSTSSNRILLYISRERLDILTTQHVRGVPDLVVEILSPGTRRVDEVTKRKLYERSGVREYWVVDPELDTIKVYRSASGGFGKALELTGEAGDSLSTPLLPGWSFPAADVFASPL